MTGLLHVYTGTGKGKTTASVGLSVRAAGAGLKVLFVQFSKDGSSSEIKVLESIPGIRTMYCPKPYGFFKFMKEEEKAQAIDDYRALFYRALAEARENVDLLVLDEAASAVNNGIIIEEELVDFLKQRPEGLEVVITGRDPKPSILALADYITDMNCVRHPYEKGITARKGIEY